MTINKPVRTALDVYQSGYRNRHMMGYWVTESREFFLALREAICSEVEHKGYCTLIDQLLEHPPQKLDIVVCAVFLDLCCGYPNRLADVRRGSGYREYMPHVNIRWSTCSYMGYQYTAFDEKVADKIRRARNMVRAGHLRYLESLTEKSKAKEDTAVPTANPAEAEHQLQQAHAQAEQILAQAQLEAERINQSAQTAAENILAQAQAKAEESAKDRADKLVSRYIRQAQQEMKQECDASMADYLNETLRDARTLESIHGEMCDKTNDLQARWIKALDNTLEQLNAAKADFYQHLCQWQVALYPREVKPLAERYLELYRIINVDKLLREEVVFQSNTPQGEPAPDTVAGLHKLNKTLTTFLRRFEGALDGLGLYAYYPEAGQPYDDIWHMPEDEEEEYDGKTVRSCVLPGIAKRASDGGEDDVIIPAVVRMNA